MKILLVGGGGREHAMAWKLSQSPRCEKLYCAPGNAGIAGIAECLEIGAEDIDGLVAFVQDNEIDFVVAGPEAPLVLGLGDRIRAIDIPVFGPSKAAAELEGSKGFMKDLCAKYDIPTAAYGRFTDVEKAKEFIRAQGAPIVIKTDGLAAGKGVIIAQSVEEAEQTVSDMLSGASFGEAGREVVIEEFMEGEELSFFAVTDGKSSVSLASAQDHKRAFDGDEGPNTGGMGAYSPAHMMTPELQKKIEERIIQPTVDGLAAEGSPYQGVLFAGLMLVDGEPKLIEFNVRFGDPECQPLMMRLESDLVDLLYASATGTLESQKPAWSDDAALCVVMAADGYPGSYKKGSVIGNLEAAGDVSGVMVFHAGTATDADGQVIATGGRVLGVTACAPDFKQARQQAYEAAALIEWPEGFYRKDIGWRAMAAEEGENSACVNG